MTGGIDLSFNDNYIIYELMKLKQISTSHFSRNCRKLPFTCKDRDITFTSCPADVFESSTSTSGRPKRRDCVLFMHLRVTYHSFLCSPIMCLYPLSSIHVRYDFRIKTMFGSSLPSVVLFTLFVFVCTQRCTTHIVLRFYLVCLRLVYHMLSVSLDFPFFLLTLRCFLAFTEGLFTSFESTQRYMQNVTFIKDENNNQTCS